MAAYGTKRTIFEHQYRQSNANDAHRCCAHTTSSRNGHEALLRPLDGAAPDARDAATQSPRKNLRMADPPQQRRPTFLAWRKDIANRNGRAVSENVVRANPLMIAAKPLWREGRFQHRLNYLIME